MSISRHSQTTNRTRVVTVLTKHNFTINRSVVVTVGRLIKWGYSGYIVFFILFFLLGYTRFPNYYIASEQLLMWALGLLLTILTYRSSDNKILIAVLMFQLISIFYVRYFNVYLFGDPLGYDPHDALFYRMCGESFGGKDIRAFFVWLVGIYMSIDDWGFPFLMWGVYSVFGDLGPTAILFLNALFIAFGAKTLYNLSSRFVNKNYCGLIALMWGLSPFAVCTAVGGLKENFFCFFVIRFFYNLYCSREGHRTRVLYVIFDIVGIFLFRLSVGYAAILSLIVYNLLSSKKIRLHVKKISLIAIVVCCFVIPVAIDKIASQRGTNLENVMASSATKAESVGGASGFVANATAAFIGPFPTFITSDRDKINYITRYSFTLYIKLILSFFFFYALVLTVKRKDSMFYPIYLFTFVNILMIVVAFFALNLRFHWPHIPLFFMVSVWGIVKYSKRERHHWVLSAYLLLGFLITFVYNMR